MFFSFFLKWANRAAETLQVAEGRLHDGGWVQVSTFGVLKISSVLQISIEIHIGNVCPRLCCALLFCCQVPQIQCGRAEFESRQAMCACVFHGRRSCHLCVRSKQTKLWFPGEVRSSLGAALWYLNVRRFFRSARRYWIPTLNKAGRASFPRESSITQARCVNCSVEIRDLENPACPRYRFFFSEDLSNSHEVAGRTELINLNNTLCKTQSLKKLLLDCTLGELQFCINFYSFGLTGFTLCCNSRASVASWLGRGSLLLVPQQP